MVAVKAVPTVAKKAYVKADELVVLSADKSVALSDF